MFDERRELTHFVGTISDVTERRAAEATNQKHALALERIADVVMEVEMDEWSRDAARACRITNATPSFEAIFGQPHKTNSGFWPSLCTNADALSDLLVRSVRVPSGSARGELTFNTPQEEKTMRVWVVAADILGEKKLLAVVHDLTDFKTRIGLEKDREYVALLQHDEKNSQLAQQVDTRTTLGLLADIKKNMLDQSKHAGRLSSPELRAVFHNL